MRSETAHYSPLAAYQQISFSDKNFSTSRKTSSLIVPGRMTESHGRLGRDKPVSHADLIRLGELSAKPG